VGLVAGYQARRGAGWRRIAHAYSGVPAWPRPRLWPNSWRRVYIYISLYMCICVYIHALELRRARVAQAEIVAELVKARRRVLVADHRPAVVVHCEGQGRINS